MQEGFVRLPAAFPPADARAMLEMMWADYAEREGVTRDDPSGWSTNGGTDRRLYGTPARGLTESPEWRAVLARLQGIADELWGAGSWKVREKATLFVNCPSRPGHWKVPRGWHTDVPADPAQLDLTFVYAFAFLDWARPRGGNTILLAGSTRRIAELERADPGGRGKKFMAELAAENRWFGELFYNLESGNEDEEARADRLLDNTQVSKGIPMKLVELTGAPGDIVLWDPRALHSASCNADTHPRSVVRFRLDAVSRF